MSAIHDTVARAELPLDPEERRKALGRLKTKRYREQNAERINAEAKSEAAVEKRRLRRTANKDHVNEVKRAWYQENKDRIRDSKRPKTEEERQADCERSKKWHAENQERVKAYREKNKDRARQYREETRDHRAACSKANSLKRKYGLSVNEVNAMIDSQGGVCKCCATAFGLLRGHRPCVDHCHSTGKIRGILCDRCNLLVGHASDSPKALRNAAAYLENAG